MAPKSDGDDWLKDDDPGDWESAFQEDFEFPPEGDGYGLFPGGPGSTNPYEFSPPDEHELADLPDLDQESIADGFPGSREPLPEDREKTAGTGRLRPIDRQSFAALPLRTKLIACGGSLLGLVLILTLGLALFPRLSKVADQPHPSFSPSRPAFPPAIAVQPAHIPIKWRLAPFMLPTKDVDSSGKAVFLELDLTLLLLLAPDESIPLGQKIFVRDLIYQYYRNQSSDDLRRFALTRGEMNRSLLAWLREQWPEAPVDTIIFNHYQLR